MGSIGEVVLLKMKEVRMGEGDEVPCEDKLQVEETLSLTEGGHPHSALCEFWVEQDAPSSASLAEPLQIWVLFILQE